MARKNSPQNNFSLAKIFPIGFGGFFVAFGLVFVYFLGIQTQLGCQRSAAIHCTLRSSWMGLLNLDQRKVDNLQKSWVDSHCDDQGCTYWVMLTTASGVEIHFDDNTSSARDAQAAISNPINAGIQNLEKRAFTVSRQAGWWIILPVVFILIGLTIAIGLPLLFSAKNMTVKDKRSR